MELEPEFINPVDEGLVTSVFGGRDSPIFGSAEFHNGVDIAVPENTPVLCAADGVVSEAGESEGNGIYLRYRVSGGIEIVYAHLNKLNVKKGQKVKQGEVMAYSGSTGYSTGPHLHYGMKLNGEYIDPMEYMRKGETANAE